MLRLPAILFDITYAGRMFSHYLCTFLAAETLDTVDIWFLVTGDSLITVFDRYREYLRTLAWRDISKYFNKIIVSAFYTDHGLLITFLFTLHFFHHFNDDW